MIMKLGPLFQISSTKTVWNAPNEGLTMTSYPVFNQTSLSRKPCITAQKLLWNAIRKSWSLFQNALWKSACNAPWRRTDDDDISGTCQHMMLHPFRSVGQYCYYLLKSSGVWNLKSNIRPILCFEPHTDIGSVFRLHILQYNAELICLKYYWGP